MRIFRFIAAIILGGTVLNGSADARGNEPFPVFDAMFWRDKPDSKALGLAPLRVIYSADFVKPGEKFHDVPSRAQVQQALKAGITPITVLDIEEWPMTGSPASVADSVKKYKAALRAVRDAAPGSKFGYYGLIPIQSYNAAKAPDWSPDHLLWRAQSRALRPIADDVDALFPSAYTYSDNVADWKKFAQASIAEARRIAPGKPVYCFLWPQYYPEAKQAYQPVPASLWSMELDTCHRLADGIVLWGGFHEPGGRYETLPWKEKADWWQATRKFLALLHR